MVDGLRADGYVRSDAVEAAFMAVPRERFMSRVFQHRAYRDAPTPIGGGQTISAPHMVAIMAEALEVRAGHGVLEVGTGSGYHAAILSHLVGATGRVDSVEFDERLARRATRRMADLGLVNVRVHTGDGAQGWPQGAPFDRVSVTCAVPSLPEPLMDQTTADGVIVAPLGRGPSRLVRLRRNGSEVHTDELGPCAFVPLRGPHGFSASA